MMLNIEFCLVFLSTTCLSLSPQLSNGLISILCMKEISTLFKLRSRTIDVKANSESAHRDNMWCKTCHLFPETQEHLFQCSEIRKKQTLVNYSELSYSMIYGSLEHQEKFAKSFHLMLMTRMDLIREQKTSTPSPLEDPCTS